ncbi:uncharacterized protein LOC126184334 [Schistocerca cancellata]|uniref:uncharacterized protein LOC126184334 n=1 Tax=Schistocerca cancellata TaxID=274614 RepID=UPI002118576A|nr:uncharacterized protein LOC126184334 [Schistocerca cancellata]
MGTKIEEFTLDSLDLFRMPDTDVPQEKIQGIDNSKPYEVASLDDTNMINEERQEQFEQSDKRNDARYVKSEELLKEIQDQFKINTELLEKNEEKNDERFRQLGERLEKSENLLKKSDETGNAQFEENKQQFKDLNKKLDELIAAVDQKADDHIKKCNEQGKILNKKINDKTQDVNPREETTQET